jgi:uncharacterized membrane protein
VNKRIPLVFRQLMYNLRGGFLVRPLGIALSLGATGAVLSWVEELFPKTNAWVPAILFPSHTDPQVAQVILGGIAASIMTVVSIVFAILLMTLTLASMQFSPRIIVSFSKDRVTQQTLGIFLGTFCYCMAALPAARSVPTPFEPVVTVMGAMLLALACVGCLLFFIHHISHSISVNYIVDRIAAETEAMIDEMMPTKRKVSRMGQADPLADIEWDGAVESRESGYVRFVDAARLSAVAKRYGVKVRVLRRAGHFVPAEVDFLQVARSDRLTDEARVELRSAFDIGPSRTLQQDVEFGVLQIVDIALKAISPAVNDPSTAINCVDQLSRVLIRFASRELPAGVIYDLPGVARVIVPWISFESLLDSAFDQIRQYATGDVAVSLRLLRAIGDIASTTQDVAYRGILIDRGRRVVESCGRRLAENDLLALKSRWAMTERQLAGGGEDARGGRTQET